MSARAVQTPSAATPSPPRAVPIRIGVDATCWSLRRGFGRHARCLLTALVGIDRDNDYLFFTDSPADEAALAALGRCALVRTSAATITAASAGSRRTLGDMLAMSRAMSRAPLDLLLFPTTYSYVPVFTRARKLMLFHDVIADCYPELTLDSSRARWMWGAKMFLARTQTDALATVSDFSRRALARRYRIDPATVHVIGEASDPVFRRLDNPPPTARLRELDLPGGTRTVVYVGGFSPHKNVERLVEAFHAVATVPGFEDVRLVLVGEYAQETFFSTYGALRATIDARGLTSRVVFTGFLPDSDLVVLLNGATLLVLPSMMEGFGLPAVEAAACGCPVVATTESPLPDLLGDGGIYVDPHDTAAIAAAMRAVLDSPERQQQMRRAALAAAGRLTWTAAAHDLLRLIQQTVAER